MQKTQHNARRFAGVSFKTTHEKAPQEIGGFWGTFMKSEAHKAPKGAGLVGLYTNYEDEMNAGYDVVIGAELEDGAQVPEGWSLFESPARAVIELELSSTEPHQIGAAWMKIGQVAGRDFVLDGELYKVDEQGRPVGVTLFVGLE